MISRFFIDRPIFAAVLSIVITLAGGVSISSLSLSQFPNITPPNIVVDCTYPGASALDVSTAIAAPIEQQVNGVEGMMYMSSSCTNDGGYRLTITFFHGIDPEMAQVMVQNRVALAIPSLPDVIKQTGVTVRKRSPDPLVGFAFFSPDGRYDQLYLSNFVMRNVRDEFLRVPGVTEIFMQGQRDFSMRIWVNPNRLAARGLTASDLVRAIREQNREVAAGQIGQPPVVGGQDFQLTIDTLGRLITPEQFENIIIKSMPDGRVVRLRDVARVELDAKSHDMSSRFDGYPAVALIIFQSPDANALETRDRLQAKLDELAKIFPEGIEYDTSFDTTPYTRESIQEVLKTLLDAVLLVALVVLFFLQNWRSALIPLVAVPVAVIGTFAVMAPLGFSINTLTMFGLVLAIGIVVDDAIVVVEAVEHHIDNGLAPREATILAMEQVSGPVIAIGLVLSAVFVPCAFVTGITGQFFRQFALTIAVSTLISAFNSLTLSPALTALLLEPKHRRRTHREPLPTLAYVLIGCWFGQHYGSEALEPYLADYADGLGPMLGASFLGGLLGWLAARPLNAMLALLFRLFNASFLIATDGYLWIVRLLLRARTLVLIAYAGLVIFTYYSFQSTPKGFIPSQDMGYLLVNVQLPDSASAERTYAVFLEIEKIVLSTPGVRHASSMIGNSLALGASGSNFGSMFVNLHLFKDRQTPELSAEHITATLRRRFATEIHDAVVSVFPPPPIRGAGRAGGFSFILEDRGDNGPEKLQEQVDNLVRKGNEDSWLVGLFSVFRANVPQLKIDVNERQCVMRGVSLRDFADMLRVFEGSLYINDFTLFGRTWQVIVQGDHNFRDQPEDLQRLKVRNNRGRMVPLGSLAEIREINGPLVLTRHNMYPSAAINGNAAPGISSRQAIDQMEAIAKRELPASMAYEWSDMSFLELLAGNTALVLFGFAVAMVFLVLAAQYESWSLPLAVILVVPMCLLSAILGIQIAGKDINIFTQIGFVVLVGLACKNAILIVEFARAQRMEGASGVEAAMAACQLRFRPIIMTSLAFILGVVPLLLATGAGAEMRKALGLAVFSGMLGVTIFGVFLTPVFFITIDALGNLPLFSRRGPLRRFSDYVLRMVSFGPVRTAMHRAGIIDKPSSDLPDGESELDRRRQED